MTKSEAIAAGIPAPTLASRRAAGNLWRTGSGPRMQYWIDALQLRPIRVGDVSAWATIGPRPAGALPVEGRDDTGRRSAQPAEAPQAATTPAPHRSVTKDDPDACYYSEVDPRTRRVICYAPHWKRPLILTFEQDASLHRAYSAEGSGMTVREVGDRFGWSPETTRSALRARGLTHASAMWPAHEIDERGEDDVLGDVHAQRIQRIRQAADRQRVAELQRAHERQIQLEDWIRELLSSAPIPARPPRYSLRDERPQVYALDAMTDAHVEALASDGTGYAEQAAAVLEITDRLVVATLRAYSPERVGIIVGSDWLDADRYDGATTRGTPQRSSLPPHEAARAAIWLLGERIKRWRAVAPVDLLVVPGNHDRHLTSFLQVWCETQYADAPDVRVISDRSGRVYVRHGACCIGVTHGDTAKPGTLPGLMMEEADLAGVRHRHWITGHLHRYEVAARTGASVTIAPSVASATPWAEQNFGRGDRSSLVLCYHRDHGHVATLREIVQ